MSSRLCLAGVALWLGASACGRSSASSEGGTVGTAGRAGAGASGNGHGGGGNANAGRGAGHAGQSVDGGSSGRGGAGNDAGSTGLSQGGADLEQGGQAGSTTGGGTGGAGGSTELGCSEVICTPEDIVGPCPEAPPTWGAPCTYLGTTCAYCNVSRQCPDMLEGVLAQCCDTEDGQVWGKNCLTTCAYEGPEAQGGAGAGGQSGAGGSGDSGACTGPVPGCCNTDDDCARAFECVPATDAPHAGVCKPRLADGSQCWRNADCPDGYHCDGVLLHACGDGGQDESRGDCRPD